MASYVVEGEIRAACAHDLEQQLPGATRGEGIIELRFGHHQPVSGTIPTRPQSDRNPLNRKECLLHIAKRL